MARRKLDLTQLAQQCALSAGARESLVEAARVMLEKHEHPIPCDGTWVQKSDTEPIQVLWEVPDAHMVRTHGNEKDATEDGAYALAISAMAVLGYEVQGRTAQGSGSDYWMTRKGDDTVLYKLEVSGISEGGAPGARLSEKVKQGQGGQLRRPGIAVVFRFKDVKLLTEEWS